LSPTEALVRYTVARKELAQWLAEGKIQRKETIIKGGLQAAEQGLIDLYKGVNTGELALLFAANA
jgi:NADPH-dependent curcumin reductase CurA